MSSYGWNFCDEVTYELCPPIEKGGSKTFSMGVGWPWSCSVGPFVSMLGGRSSNVSVEIHSTGMPEWQAQKDGPVSVTVHGPPQDERWCGAVQYALTRMASRRPVPQLPDSEHPKAPTDWAQ